MYGIELLLSRWFQVEGDLMLRPIFGANAIIRALTAATVNS